MNKIVAFGIAALGASSVQLALAQPLSAPPPSKPWSVSATLRGFYDDNVNTTTDSSAKVDTFGIEFSPAVGLSWMDDANTAKVGFRYSLLYYGKRVNPNSNQRYDQDYTFNGSLEHAFNDRYRIGVSDAFVVGQEPDVRDTASNQHIPGDNIRNFGTITLNGQITHLFSVETGYRNSFFDYHDKLDSGETAPPASNSGALDRVENNIYFEGQWLMLPQTLGILGYEFGMVNYTGDEPLGFDYLGGTNNPAMSKDRDSRSHYFYAGVDHKFQPDLSGSLRVGIQYISFYNQPSAASLIGEKDSGTSPYVQAALTYTYAPESYVRAGFTQKRSPTYNVDSQDADTSVVFGTIYHRILPRLYGSATGTFQNSSFNGGTRDGDSDRFFQLGLNLTYRLTPNLSTEIGYNYDHLTQEKLNGTSDSSYDRNRVYIGVTASY